MSVAKVTVVIPTLGQRSCLAQVASQILHSFSQQADLAEIIVVWDAPEGAVLPHSLENLPPKTRLLHSWAQGPSRARNTGAAGVTTDRIVFLDDDILVEDGWGDKIMTLPNLPVIWAGAIDPTPGVHPSRADQEQGCKWFGPNQRPLRKREYAAAGHLIFSFNAWRRLSGFSDNFGSCLHYSRNEDVEIQHRARTLGIPIFWEPELRATHLHRQNLSQYEMFEQGRADFAIDLYYDRQRVSAKLLGHFVRWHRLKPEDLSRLRSAGYTLEAFAACALSIVKLIATFTRKSQSQAAIGSRRYSRD